MLRDVELCRVVLPLAASRLSLRNEVKYATAGSATRHRSHSSQPPRLAIACGHTLSSSFVFLDLTVNLVMVRFGAMQGAEVHTSEPGLILHVYRRFFRARTLVRLGGSDNSRDLGQALTGLR